MNEDGLANVQRTTDNKLFDNLEHDEHRKGYVWRADADKLQ
jgi:hypothetical protein